MNLNKILNTVLPVSLALGLAACATTRDAVGEPWRAMPLMGDWRGYRVPPPAPSFRSPCSSFPTAKTPIKPPCH
ncbi:MAG: hypothetical protein IPI01_18065 [Ignavibacteriae bacterium]|nr:hypothetical protein [Ignavibacteriota bacterium]